MSHIRIHTNIIPFQIANSNKECTEHSAPTALVTKKSLSTTDPEKLNANPVTPSSQVS